MKSYLKGSLLLSLMCLLALAFSGVLPFSAVQAAEAEGILVDSRFPDYKFRKALDDRYGDGNHNVSFFLEDIDVSDSGIEDLTGIELFTRLETLDCSGNQLGILDCSRIKKVRILDCRNNPLTSLNTGMLDDLQSLYCSGDQLGTISLPTNKLALKYVDISNSRIPVLDVQGYVNLEGVNCANGALIQLNASGCTNLMSVNLNNCPLTTLSVAECDHLEYLYAENCSLPSLSISGLESLNTVRCINNPMTSLTISACPALETVDCYDNSLSSLSINNCENLEDLNCQNNLLTALPVIPSLDALDCSHNRISSLGSYPELAWLNCADNQLRTLSVPEWVYSLDCSGNRLTSLDVSQCADMSSLDCSDNALTSLNVQGLSELHMLYAHSNSLLPSVEIGGTNLGSVDGVWLGEYHGAVAMKWGEILTIDPKTALLRNGQVIYQPEGSSTPLPTFFLPYGLTAIESDAFRGIAAEAVLIPASVTSISGDPFAGSNVQYIYGYPGTAAEELAAGRYTFIPVGQGD